jgi:hypothetical protein
VTLIAVTPYGTLNEYVPDPEVEHVITPFDAEQFRFGTAAHAGKVRLTTATTTYTRRSFMKAPQRPINGVTGAREQTSSCTFRWVTMKLAGESTP